MAFYTNITTHRGKLLHIGYKNGSKFIKKHDFTPTLYTKSSNPDAKWRSLYDEPLDPIVFESISKYKEYIKQYSEIMELHGNIKPEYQAINHYYKNLTFDASQIRTILWDIEVISKDGSFPYPEHADYPITSIALKDIVKNRYHVFGLKEYDGKFDKVSAEIRYHKCDTEEILLRQFLLTWEEISPDIIIGWYSNNFDIPYTINRITKVLGDEHLSRLSPVGVVRSSASVNGLGRTVYRNTIQGVSILDYMELYQKYIFTPRESYSLNYICSEELGKEKVDYTEFDNLYDLWKNNHKTFIDYNIYDVELIHLLDDKLKLLELHYTLTYMYRCNFEDSMGTVTPWDTLVNYKLRLQNKICPPNIHKRSVDYAGAYVHDPKPGIYKWIATGDLNSLYPHLIMQFNLSAETIVDGVYEDVKQSELDERFLNKEIKANPKYILAANGQYFRKDIKGLFPQLMEEIYVERKEVKKEMLKLEQEYENIMNELAKRGGN